ncbi:MAG: NUDIX domain-containing protein [Verrucomicrobia bacterium]|nr:NUDIX domain-containing protein [Verrucomicrobiota bacterium]
MYRLTDQRLEVLLVHPGGPFWEKKDSWTFPRGELLEGEIPLAGALREFWEETSIEAKPPYIDLGSARQKSGKMIYAWAFAGSCDPTQLRSNLFEMEWPPHSGKLSKFPEIDEAKFFTVAAAQKKMRPSEWPFIERLQQAVRVSKEE